MTDKLHCPFCSDEMIFERGTVKGIQRVVCRNPKCIYDGWHFPVEIIQRMIDGKKAQDALIEIKQTLDECFLREKGGFTVSWDVIARWSHDTITYATKQEE